MESNNYDTEGLRTVSMSKYFTVKGLGVTLASFVTLVLLDVILLLTLYVFYKADIALVFVVAGYLLSTLTVVNLVILGVMVVKLRKRNTI